MICVHLEKKECKIKPREWNKDEKTNDFVM